MSEVMHNRTKIITTTGIGIALFVVLSLCLQVPVFQNYYLCLGYVVMAYYLYFLGIRSGTIVGFLGTILYCLLINGLRGMPGWAIGNIFVGVIVGCSFKAGKAVTSKIFRYVIYLSGILLGCLCGILVVKSLVEHFLYAQPMLVRVITNTYAFIADVAMLLFSVPICVLLEPHVRKLTR